VFGIVIGGTSLIVPAGASNIGVRFKLSRLPLPTLTSRFFVAHVPEITKGLSIPLLYDIAS